MVVEVGCAEGGLSSGSSPDRVDAALTATVQRAVSVALVEGDEESRPSRLERVTIQNIRHQALQIIVSRGDRRGADSTRTTHIITIIRRQPHEVGRGRRVQIINQNTVGNATGTWIRENKLVTTSSITRNVLEGYERIMNRLIRLVRARVTAPRNILVFKISLPA